MNGYSIATLELKFTRRCFYHLLNIFLQSFLLVITGYMSFFFHVNDFSDRVMVALTVLLVMASLQTSVQEAIPKTAYFKFIDWWILFSLNTQIVIMAFHTYLATKCYREYEDYKHGQIITKINKITTKKSMANVARGAWKVAQLEAEESSGEDAEVAADGRTDEELEAAYHLDMDDLKGPDEYHYPEAKKTNRLVAIIFLAITIAFNVVYWIIALIVYNGFAHISNIS